MKNVDIVIPIYNAYDFVKLCIESVIKNTDLKKHTLVLVDDKSPDERIVPLLEDFVKNYSDLNIVFKQNKENKGFVKTVNVGMENSEDNDVILLNSDTEVTKNWIEKIQECAYSQSRVATVTPLSNNATLASVPNAMYDNVLPEGYTLEEYAKLIEEISFKSFPQIPTAHGFCMYITRKAIKDVGLFDDVLFEKGYGEENDFSYRALNLGYKHLMCDNTFIYHKGTQSFSSEKEEFVKSHIKVLMDKYPKCFNNTDEFARNYPLGYIQSNLKFEINCTKRKNLLFIIHDFRELKEKNLGGTTLHIYDLIKNLRGKYNFHILFPDKIDSNLFMLKSYFKESEEEIILNDIVDYSQVKLYNKKYYNMIKDVVRMLKIDLIHVHHLLKNYYDVYDVAKEYNIPVITSIHDFYMACPTVSLLNNNYKFCGGVNREGCKECLRKKLNVEGDLIDIWQEISLKALKISKVVVAPSNNTKKIMSNIFKGIDITVIEHGVDKSDTDDDVKIKKDNKFNIAFLGGISEHKGIFVLRYLMEKFKGTDINIHLFGDTNDVNCNSSKGNYIYHGVYDRKDIIKLLKENNINLICLFSICPETYSYTLTEGFLAGIPAISFNIGAQSERIEKYGAGVIVDINSDMEKISDRILEIKNDKKLYTTLVENTKKTIDNFKTVSDMSLEYDKLYEKTINKNKVKYNTEETRRIRKQYIYDNIAKNYIYTRDKKMIKERDIRIEGYDALVKSIVNSKRWKLVGNFQLPRFIKKILKK